MTCHLATELGLALTALFLIPHHEGSSTEYTYTVISIEYSTVVGFPGGSDSKASVYNTGDPGSIPGLGRSLEKEMAVHSSTIAWKIPWTEEPGRLQSMGSQRVRHD